jgi:hypothetical protein
MIRLVALCLTAIALLCFPSIQYDLSLDGAYATYSGFPLPWNSPSLVTSMAKDIYAIPLAIDLLFYGWLAHLVLRRTERLPRKPRMIVMSLLYLWGVCCMAFILFTVSMGGFFHMWPQPGPFEITAVRLGFAL